MVHIQDGCYRLCETVIRRRKSVNLTMLRLASCARIAAGSSLDSYVLTPDGGPESRAAAGLLLIIFPTTSMNEIDGIKSPE